MNRRGFIGLLAGALPAMALSNRKYFFAPAGGWTQTESGIWQVTNDLHPEFIAIYRFVPLLPSVVDPAHVIRGYWERLDAKTGDVSHYSDTGLRVDSMSKPFDLTFGGYRYHWTGLNAALSSGLLMKETKSVHELDGTATRLPDVIRG